MYTLNSASYVLMDRERTMDEKTELAVNLNTATGEELAALPGIGPDLAARIEAQRPYHSEEDLLKVKGIGKVLLGRLQPLVSFNSTGALPLLETRDESLPDQLDSAPLDEEPASDRADLTQMDSITAAKEVDAAEAESLPDPDSAPPPAADRKDRPVGSAESKRPLNMISRGDTLWLLAGTSFVSVVAAVLVTLLVLVLINGTLRIERSESFIALEGQVTSLSGSLDQLDADLAVAQQKLVALEGLSGRMTMVEGQIESIQGQVEAAAAEVDAMQTTVVELQDQTTALTTRVGVFDTFFVGLQDLLGSIFNFEQPAAENSQ